MERRDFLKIAAIVAVATPVALVVGDKFDLSVPEFPSEPLKLNYLGKSYFGYPNNPSPDGNCPPEATSAAYSSDGIARQAMKQNGNSIFQNDQYSLSWSGNSSKKEDAQPILLQSADKSRTYGKLTRKYTNQTEYFGDVSTADVGNYLFLNIGGKVVAIDKEKNQLLDVDMYSLNSAEVLSGGINNTLFVTYRGMGGGIGECGPMHDLCYNGSLQYVTYDVTCYQIK